MEIIKPRMTLAQVREAKPDVYDMLMAALAAFDGALPSPSEATTPEVARAHLHDLYDSGRVHPLWGDYGCLWAMLYWDEETKRYCVVELRSGCPMLLHIHGGRVNLTNQK